MSAPARGISTIDLPLPEERELSARPPGYRAFFACFNSGRFFEAHEELEVCWLEVRGQPLADFYKALIQVAGVFVHQCHGRPGPARRLLERAAELLRPYPSPTAGLDVDAVRARLRRWREALPPREALQRSPSAPAYQANTRPGGPQTAQPGE
jgi:hypothetical protein